MMAFPQTPLDIRTELFIDGQWVDVSGDVYNRDPVQITYGRADEASRPDPTSCTFTLNNRDGKYSPRNPRSPLYGKVGRNTPVRISVPGGESYVSVDGSLAQRVYTPYDPVMDLAGNDLDVRVEASMDWDRPGSQSLIGQWEAEGDQRTWWLRVNDGLLTLNMTTDGTKEAGYFWAWSLPALPRRAAVRCTVDAATTTVRFYWATSLDGPWEQIREPINVGAVVPFVSTAPLVIAPGDDTYPTPRMPMVGDVHRAEVRIGGVLVAAPDFRQLAVGTTEFTDAPGRAWTVAGDAPVSNRAVRFEGEVSSWPNSWTPNGGDSWVSVQASGLSRRLGQRAKPLTSALTRRITSYKPVAYWPFEEDEGSVRAWSPIDGVRPADAQGFQFGSEAPGGSAPLPTVGPGCYLNAQVPLHEGGDFWAVSWVMYLPDVPQNEITLLAVATSGTAVRHYLKLGPAGLTLQGFGPQAGESFLVQEEKYKYTSPAGSQAFNDLFGRWIRMRFRAILPSNTSLPPRVEIQWVGIGTPITWSAWADFTTTSRSAWRPGAVSRIYCEYGEHTNGFGFGHLTVLTQESQYTAFDFADHGYTGELGHERLERIAAESGVPIDVYAPEGMPAMGPQRPMTLLDTLDDIAQVDGGVLTESLRGRSLLYRARSTVYNQTPKLTMTFGQVAPPLLPVDDDQHLVNDATVSRYAGSRARAVVESGPMSVQDPPDGVGRYDEGVEVNAGGDDQLQPYADWMVHTGTWEESRYPLVRLNLATNPELIPGVLRLELLDRMVVNNPPDWLPPDPIDLLVQGWTETLTLTTWDLEINATPYGPWDVGSTVETADPGAYRADTDGSTLHLPVDTESTEFHVTVKDGPHWIAAGRVLNANPDFADGLAGWWGDGATLTRVPTPNDAPFTSPWSMQVVPDGVAQYPNAGSEQIPVTVGRTYVASGWLRSATARTVALNINWFDAENNYLTTTANDTEVAAGEWTWFELTATAPEGASFVNLAPTVPDFPPSTDVLLVALPTLRRDTPDGDPSQFPVEVTIGGEHMLVRSIEDSVWDTFSRTVVDGWGAADSDDPWKLALGGVTQFAVNGEAGTIRIDPAIAPQTSVRAAELYYEYEDSEVVACLSSDMVPTAGQGQLAGVYTMGATDDGQSLFFWTNLAFVSGGVLALQIRNIVTVVATVTLPFTWTPGTKVWLRTWTQGHRVRARAWLDGMSEPKNWLLDHTIEDAPQSTGTVGVMVAATDLVNTPTISVHDFRMVNPQTFTVVRGGLVMDHPAGVAVNVTHPLRIAW